MTSESQVPDKRLSLVVAICRELAWIVWIGGLATPMGWLLGWRWYSDPESDGVRWYAYRYNPRRKRFDLVAPWELVVLAAWPISVGFSAPFSGAVGILVGALFWLVITLWVRRVVRWFCASRQINVPS